jgi:ribose transport system substrate-binding protein
MNSKISKIFAALLIMAFVLTACAPAAPAATAEPVAAKKVIGFSVYDMQYGFFQDMEKGTKEAALAAGYDYLLVDEKSSESTMVSATIDLINQGISALIISPFKPDALGPIVDAAKAKGIPVVVDDIGGGGSAYDAIVISNNEEGGVMAAVQMDKLISASGKPKKVASITCEASAVYAARRNVGFETKIKELGYEVVATLSGNSQQEQGYKVMQDILTANPDVSGVFSCNDPMAVGAAQAVKDSGKSGATDIYVIGFNADQIALESIKAGDMAATVQQVPFEMGKTTVALATKLMAGEKLTYDNADAREIFVPVNLITAETLGVKPPEPAAKKVIGFSVYDMQYGFFQDMEKGTKEAATAAGYDYILVDEKSSESTMVSATIDLINQGIDALIISPFKPDALGPIVDAAKAKGIPVVVDDIGGGGSDYDAIVISNNEEGGVMAAEQMDKLISAAGKPKKVASITCEASAVYAARRNVGFENKIKELGYEVVATLSGNSQQEQGYKVMQDILTANPDVSGVFSCNDPMAVGAAQAIKDAGKSGSKDIYVIGFNADQIALESIKAGDMAATIQQVPFEMGKMTVDLATKLMAGEKLTYDNADAREIFVPVNLITIDNLP